MLLEDGSLAGWPLQDSPYGRIHLSHSTDLTKYRKFNTLIPGCHEYGTRPSSTNRDTGRAMQSRESSHGRTAQAWTRPLDTNKVHAHNVPVVIAKEDERRVKGSKGLLFLKPEIPHWKLERFRYLMTPKPGRKLSLLVLALEIGSPGKQRRCASSNIVGPALKVHVWKPR